MTGDGLTASRVRVHYDRIAKDYDERDITAKGRGELIVRLLEINKGSLVLDVAGGTGKLGIGIVDSGGVYVSLDFSKSMQSIAKEGLCNRDCHLILADAGRIPFREGVFDAAICSEVLEHVLDPTVVLAETKNALKRGGILVVTNPNILWAPVEFLAEKLGMKPLEGPHRYIVPWKLRSLVQEFGFQISEETIMYTPFLNFSREKLLNNLRFGWIYEILFVLAMKQILRCVKR